MPSPLRVPISRMSRPKTCGRRAVWSACGERTGEMSSGRATSCEQVNIVRASSRQSSMLACAELVCVKGTRMLHRTFMCEHDKWCSATKRAEPKFGGRTPGVLSTSVRPAGLAAHALFVAFARDYSSRRLSYS
eukprot:3491105-Prymnesium_polylepis.1